FDVAPDCGRLLFLDDYDEAPPGTDLEVLLYEALRLGSRVVVTSRSQAPPSLLPTSQYISLDSMSRRDATSVLAEFGIRGPEALQAACELGDHPLALMVFARYVASGKHTAAEALKHLRSRALDYTTSEPATLGTLQATLITSVQALTSDARRLLKSLCTAPD